jgi:hypothetical protein
MSRNVQSIGLTPNCLDIYHAITYEQRLHAIHHALEAVSHSNMNLHSYELDQGAVHALILQLGYFHLTAVASATKDPSTATETMPYPHRRSFTENPIPLICQCLHHILSKCSPSKRISLWKELGPTELIPLLLQSSPYSWPILSLFFRMGQAKTTLISFPGMIDNIVYILDQADFLQDGQTILTIVLGALQDLSFQSHRTIQLALWEVPIITAHLLAIVDRNLDKVDVLSVQQKEHISGLWWNFALSLPELQADRLILGALQKLLQDQSSFKIRQNAIAALGNMLSSNELKDGETFWNTLLRMSLQEEDHSTRRRILRCIRCLLSNKTVESSIPINPSEIMHTLGHVASHDSHYEIRLQALEGMRHLERFSECDTWTNSILQIIETSSPCVSSSENNASDMRTIWTTFQMLPNNTEIVIIKQKSENFWKVVEQLMDTVPESYSKISILIDASTESLEGGGEQIKDFMPSPVLLDILAKLLQSPEYRIRPWNILRSLLQCHKPSLVASDTLLSSLITLCLSSTDNDEKDLAKSLLVQLIPEL